MNLANKLTILRIALIPLFIWVVLSGMAYGRLVAALVFALASVTDAIDGYIARKRNETTNLGKLLDPLADKLLVSAALIALVQIGLVSTWAAVLIVGREFLVTGLRGIAATDGIVIAASNPAKLKTVFQVAAMIMLLLDDYFLAFVGCSPGIWLLYLASILTVYTGYDYVAKTFAQIKMV